MKNAEDYWEDYKYDERCMLYRQFKEAFSEHDNEIISEIEKKVKIAEECSLHITAEAFTEIINLIKET